MLYVNADDLGFTKDITDRILTCYCQEMIHTASAMTFMKDSERAAEMARKMGLPVGLHLNLTQELTGERIGNILQTKHRAVTAYLKARKVNQILYNPLLRNAFEYTFQAQWSEFYRLYGEEATRLDGHHHMHLCMNMLVSGKLPKGIRIRRNFTFRPCEKNKVNRLYRHLVDCWLRSRFLCTDFFFSMAPIDQNRLQRLILLSRSSDVELMVHPGVEAECSFLLSPEWANLISEKNFDE
jgi:chitin disaccharide deacetylase